MPNFIEILGEYLKDDPEPKLYFSNSGEIGGSILSEPSGRDAVSQERSRSWSKKSRERRIYWIRDSLRSKHSRWIFLKISQS